MTLEELERFVTHVTAAQSVLLASILRAFLVKGALTESELNAVLDATEQAALQRRTPETPALTGLVALLRRDLGLDAGTPPGPS